jgi:transketolase
MDSKTFAKNIRIDALKMTHLGHASHIASAFSAADIVAVLYCDIMRFDPSNLKWEGRDRLILSKGHAGSVLYSALAEEGFFDKSILWTYCQNGSVLSGHISHKGVPGVEFSSGSLGHGVCVATGMAMAGKMDKSSYRVFAIVGDGECDEGSVWETAMFANNYKLSNLTVIVDHNKMQAMGFCEDVMKPMDLRKKFEDFGWEAVEIDGNNHEELKKALSSHSNTQPKCIIADTIKGKGVSFMENNLVWHYRDPQGEDFEKALKELEDGSYA